MDRRNEDRRRKGDNKAVRKVSEPESPMRSKKGSKQDTLADSHWSSGLGDIKFSSTHKAQGMNSDS